MLEAAGGYSRPLRGAPEENVKGRVPTYGVNPPPILRLAIVAVDRLKLGSAILCPRCLVTFVRCGVLFAVGDNVNAVGRDTKRYEVLHRCTGTTLAESHVVLARSTLVTMTGNHQTEMGVVSQELCVGLELGPLVGTDL